MCVPRTSSIRRKIETRLPRNWRQRYLTHDGAPVRSVEAMSDGETYMRIGEVAELVGLSHRTIHYYEEVGLAVPVGCTDGGFRLYDSTIVERLRTITHIRPLGLSLEQMGRFLEARMFSVMRMPPQWTGWLRCRWCPRPPNTRASRPDGCAGTFTGRESSPNVSTRCRSVPRIWSGGFGPPPSRNSVSGSRVLMAPRQPVGSVQRCRGPALRSRASAPSQWQCWFHGRVPTPLPAEQGCLGDR